MTNPGPVPVEGTARHGRPTATDERAAGDPQAVLEARARDLARAVEAPDRGGGEFEALAFRLAGQPCAIDLHFVREVVPIPPVAAVPGRHEILLGACNIRGELVAVADLGRLLGLPTTSLRDAAALVVLGSDRPDIAFGVDQIPEVVRLGAADVVPPDPAGRPAPFVRGVANATLTLLDGRELLRDRGLTVAGPGPAARED